MRGASFQPMSYWGVTTVLANPCLQQSEGDQRVTWGKVFFPESDVFLGEMREDLPVLFSAGIHAL